MTTQTKPIDLYYAGTPNGRKITIMLEELGVPYNLHWINIGKGDQFTPEFLAISPNNKIPAIVDPEGPGGEPISIFESGAILKYLAHQVRQVLPVRSARPGQGRRVAVLAGRRLRPNARPEQPLLGLRARKNPLCHQALQGRDAPPVPRPRHPARQMFAAGKDYVAGDYSIADIAILDWSTSYLRYEIDPNEFKNFDTWRNAWPPARLSIAPWPSRSPAGPSNLATDKEALQGPVQPALSNQRGRVASAARLLRGCEGGSSPSASPPAPRSAPGRAHKARNP